MHKPPNKTEIYQAAKDLRGIFPARLQLAKKRSGLLGIEIEKITGMSHRGLWQLTRGHHLPGAAILMKLALTLDVSADWLLGLDGDRAGDSRESQK